MYCDIERYQQKLLLHHDFSIFGRSINKNLNSNISHSGALFNIARDPGMTATHHKTEYGPSEFAGIASESSVCRTQVQRM